MVAFVQHFLNGQFVILSCIAFWVLNIVVVVTALVNHFKERGARNAYKKLIDAQIQQAKSNATLQKITTQRRAQENEKTNS